jgi:CheY-like chemotaxis protein
MSTLSPNDLNASPPAVLILVVDDQQAVRAFLASFLGRKGYSVFTADSGESALGLWRQMSIKPHLLITDLIMPGMGGKDLAALLKQFQPGLKVLFISGAGFELMEEAQSAVAQSQSLFKPFSPDQMIATIQAILDQP